jgi:hypothetical protein
MPMLRSCSISVNHNVMCMPFTSGTRVTEAGRDERTTESCSIATLMKHTTAFINSFYTESIWSEKACQVLRVKVTLAQGSTVKINSLLSPLKWEQRNRRST